MPMDIKDLHRAIGRLDKYIIYPSSFYRVWYETPAPVENVPELEICDPWYNDLEEYLT